jgi:opacity protein-like surface antigen
MHSLLAQPIANLVPIAVHSAVTRGTVIAARQRLVRSRKEEQMRRLLIGLTAISMCLAAPFTASAQERVPHAESTAVGIDVGVFLPQADQFDRSPLVNVFYEYYVTPRVSLRSDFGWANPGFKGGGSESLKQVPLRLDVNYNWEGGRWHPFVGAGVGAYFLQFKADNGQTFGETETKFGLNYGGGIEYFLHRALTLKGEGRYHAVASTRGQSPSGFALSVGLKTYF